MIKNVANAMAWCRLIASASCSTVFSNSGNALRSPMTVPTITPMLRIMAAMAR